MYPVEVIVGHELQFILLQIVCISKMTVRACQPSAHYLECKEIVTGREDSLDSATGREDSQFCQDLPDINTAFSSICPY